MIIKESTLRRYIRQHLLRESRLLTELKDYANPKFSDYTTNDYFVMPIRETPGVVMTVPFNEAGSLPRFSEMDKFPPGSIFKDFDLNPGNLERIKKMVSAGLAKIVWPGRPEPVKYPDIEFKYRKGEEGSFSASWRSPQDVPDTYIAYQVFGPSKGDGLRVNHNKGEISMDLSFLDWMNRRGGKKPGSDPNREYPSYVIPSGDVTTGTTQDIKKLLKHVSQKDTRDIMDYPIVGNEKFYGMTVRDALEQRGASELQRATDPSVTDLVAYHGTSSKLVKDILSKGLRPGKSQYSYLDQAAGWSEGNVYLTLSPTTAENYATRAAIWYGGKPTVLRVTVPDTAKIVADEDTWGEFKLDEPITANAAGDARTHLHPRDWARNRDHWLEMGWIDERTAENIDAQVEREIKANIKTGMKGSSSAFAYRGPIMPKFIEKWREYPKKSYGPESKLEQEKYDKIRADVLAKMKRLDQPKYPNN